MWKTIKYFSFTEKTVLYILARFCEIGAKWRLKLTISVGGPFFTCKVRYNGNILQVSEFFCLDAMLLTTFLHNASNLFQTYEISFHHNQKAFHYSLVRCGNSQFSSTQNYPQSSTVCLQIRKKVRFPFLRVFLFFPSKTKSVRLPPNIS